MKYYVYVLYDPRNNKPFYVGKGCGERSIVHEQLVKKHGFHPENDKLGKKISKIVGLGLSIIHKRSEPMTEDAALKLERKKELQFRRKGIDLCNLVPCGQKTPRWEKGPRADEIKSRISKKMEGNQNAKGHRDTAETRKKKSDSRKGWKYSEETRRKISESVKKNWKEKHGPVTEETRKRISEASKKTWKSRPRIMSEETKKKISDKLTGRKLSPEQRKKISEGMRKRNEIIQEFL